MYVYVQDDDHDYHHGLSGDHDYYHDYHHHYHHDYHHDYPHDYRYDYQKISIFHFIY